MFQRGRWGRVHFGPQHLPWCYNYVLSVLKYEASLNYKNTRYLLLFNKIINIFRFVTTNMREFIEAIIYGLVIFTLSVMLLIWTKHECTPHYEDNSPITESKEVNVHRLHRLHLN